MTVKGEKPFLWWGKTGWNKYISRARVIHFPFTFSVFLSFMTLTVASFNPKLTRDTIGNLVNCTLGISFVLRMVQIWICTTKRLSDFKIANKVQIFKGIWLKLNLNWLCTVKVSHYCTVKTYRLQCPFALPTSLWDWLPPSHCGQCSGIDHCPLRPRMEKEHV